MLHNDRARPRVRRLPSHGSVPPELSPASPVRAGLLDASMIYLHLRTVIVWQCGAFLRLRTLIVRTCSTNISVMRCSGPLSAREWRRPELSETNSWHGAQAARPVGRGARPGEHRYIRCVRRLHRPHTTISPPKLTLSSCGTRHAGSKTPGRLRASGVERRLEDPETSDALSPPVPRKGTASAPLSRRRIPSGLSSPMRGSPAPGSPILWPCMNSSSSSANSSPVILRGEQGRVWCQRLASAKALLGLGSEPAAHEVRACLALWGYGLTWPCPTLPAPQLYRSAFPPTVHPLPTSRRAGSRSARCVCDRASPTSRAATGGHPKLAHRSTRLSALPSRKAAGDVERGGGRGRD